MRNGITNSTYESMLVGPGAVYRGFISPASPGTLVGATLGGNQITIQRTFHAPELDGMLGPVKGTQRIVAEIPKIQTRIAEVNKDTLSLALTGITQTAVGSPVAHTKLTSTGQISNGNYQNIAIVGDITNKNEPIIFVCKNAIATEPLEISTGTGKDDVAFSITFTGHYDPASPELAPYEIYTPSK